LALGLLVVGLIQVGQRQAPWAAPLDLVAHFTHLRGIERGTPVCLSGHPIGEVRAIDLPAQPGAPFTVHLRLHAPVGPLLTSAAHIRVRSEGLIGTRTLDIAPGSPDAAARPLTAGSALAVAHQPELSEVLAAAQRVIGKIEQGEGSLGKLLMHDELYQELRSLVADTRAVLKQGQATLAGMEQKVEVLANETKGMLRASQDTIDAVKQDADAIKRMPIVRGYVEDATKLLVRPSHSRERVTYAETELFEPGRAVLTTAGKDQLDAIGLRLIGEWKHKDSEIVVVAYADAKVSDRSTAAAKTLTEQQSEVVANYLKDKHGVHKLGWWSRRKVTPLGLGVHPPPLKEPTEMPPARVEVVLFTPQS
jgi:phospholipid/cholesterol/gamma-HCH transport system substrate-binding protein